MGSRFFYRVLRKTWDFKIICCAILSNNKKNQDVAVWLTARWHLLCCSWGIESMCRNHNNVEDISKIVIFLKKTGNVHSRWFWQFTICLVLCSAWIKVLHTENLQALTRAAVQSAAAMAIFRSVFHAYRIMRYFSTREKELLYKLFSCFSYLLLLPEEVVNHKLSAAKLTLKCVKGFK